MCDHGMGRRRGTDTGPGGGEPVQPIVEEGRGV